MYTLQPGSGVTARTTLNKRLHGVLTSKRHLIMKLSRNAKSKIKKNNAAHVQTPSSGHFLTATCAMTCAVANVSSQLPRESLLPDRWPWQLCEHPPVLPGAAQSCFCCDQRHLADVPMTTTPPYSHSSCGAEVDLWQTGCRQIVDGGAQQRLQARF